MDRYPYEIVGRFHRGELKLFVAKVDTRTQFGMTDLLLRFLCAEAFCQRCGVRADDLEIHIRCAPDKRGTPTDIPRDLELSIPIDQIDPFLKQVWEDTKRKSAFTRQLRVNAAPGSHTPEQIRTLVQLQEQRCFYCFDSLIGPDGHINGPGGPTTCHKDHYVSLVHGGTHDIANIVLACTRCNSRKRELHGDDYKEESLREASPATRKHLARIHRARAQYVFK